MRHAVALFALILPPSIAAQHPDPILEESASPPTLTLEQQTGLRCAAAFALVAQAQSNGDARAASFPPLVPRGREYFVRFSAKLIDDTGMTRDAVAARLAAEARAIAARSQQFDLMPSCLVLLDAAGL